MHKLFLGIALICVSACSSETGNRPPANVEIEKARPVVNPGPYVVSKSDLEKADFSDLRVSGGRVSQSSAMRAIGVPGSTVSGTSDGFVITVPEDPFFVHPSSRIQPNAMPYLTRLAGVLLKDGHTRLDIIAHYHHDGMNWKALAESEKRAVAFQAALMSRGVPLSLTRAVGAGDRNPVATNNDPLGQKTNRRIELHFRRTR